MLYSYFNEPDFGYPKNILLSFDTILHRLKFPTNVSVLCIYTKHVWIVPFPRSLLNF